MEKERNLIIIGSGPAGLTAAIYASRANLAPLIIEGNTPGGQLMGTSYVENWPGEKRILGPTLMMNMRKQAEKLGTEFLAQEVTAVQFSKKPFTITMNNNESLTAHAIIIATGAIPNKLKCPGEDEYWGKGVTSCAICDATFYAKKKVVIVGGGDTAMEDALFLKKFTNDITIVQILDQFTASHAMQKPVLDDPDIKKIYGSTVTKIHGNNQNVTGVTISNKKTKKETTLDTDGVFIAIGLKPNTTPFKEQIALDANGYIQIENDMSTSVKGVFAAGDVHDYYYKQAVTAAGYGCMAALNVERYLKDVRY